VLVRWPLPSKPRLKTRAVAQSCNPWRWHPGSSFGIQRQSPWLHLACSKNQGCFSFLENPKISQIRTSKNLVAISSDKKATSPLFLRQFRVPWWRSDSSLGLYLHSSALGHLLHKLLYSDFKYFSVSVSHDQVPGLSHFKLIKIEARKNILNCTCTSRPSAERWKNIHFAVPTSSHRT
jgi:hypothetical protein